ncbi:hypothetical protein [Phage Phass-1]|uniref:Uncharacterized protein n=1 Tax=Phage Phass-1 TaxID=3043662 RepID=A0AAF0LX05_9CAUD|nr:hypothetical protein [Phage Phass-1]
MIHFDASKYSNYQLHQILCPILLQTYGNVLYLSKQIHHQMK